MIFEKKMCFQQYIFSKEAPVQAFFNVISTLKNVSGPHLGAWRAACSPRAGRRPGLTYRKNNHAPHLCCLKAEQNKSSIICIILGLSISEVEFPSVVICSQGININAIVASMQYHILDLSNTTTNKEFDLTPFQSANLTFRLLRKVYPNTIFVNLFILPIF